MEAPDKIFLAFDHGFVAQSSNVKEDINGNSFFLPQYTPIEYIRKDALLEWAKEHKRVIETRGNEKDAYLRGEYSALNSLIDKLNVI